MQKIIQFMRYRHIAVTFSALLVLGSIFSLSTRGLSFGLDFTGGALIELNYQKPTPLSLIRDQLKQAGFDNAIVQNFGSLTDVVIRMPGDDPQLGHRVVDTLTADHMHSVQLKRIEFVGPQVGSDLREQGGIGMIVALLMIMAYIAVRFQYKFAIGAVVSLAHDVIVTLGFFSLLGLQFDLTVLAAILSVIGYSLNDTIIVFDRIRENFRHIRSDDVSHIINVSWSQTLGRTLATSSTTLIVLLCLFFYGGEMIHTFAIALIVGVAIGTYSSVYVAASILLSLKLSRTNMLPPAKSELVDDNP